MDTLADSEEPALYNGALESIELQGIFCQEAQNV